ncbi:hypothetical protein [Parabacteroides sp. Marseille-P3160]|uniref:hypothetical protein n=1 Tax=Parabacteroides sp. Marseille-P3160 TaxID=1917887 RepID=UPI001118B94D|nr:hypothetical protein [Parabacteroides sp. Marseille-P3160]
MDKFKSIFGYYPKVVGCWFIDSHSLGYMYKKYGIEGSCNMKDQIGTDGYSLWGGYWNNAFYPSKINAYMPAQSAENQIPVPIFRMLGSDPIYQYDNGLGETCQSVESLETVFKDSGANPAWVDYFFQSAFNAPCLNFSYVQAGQENSFTWALIKDGLTMQVQKLDSLRAIDVIRIETLLETSRWFKAKYPTPPPITISALNDYKRENNKTVWYNSRFYRANLLWGNDSFRFRDIHFFDENIKSEYFQNNVTTTTSVYQTLPVVDGFQWSNKTNIAGLRLVKLNPKEQSSEIILEDPIVNQIDDTSVQIRCKARGLQCFFLIRLSENCIGISCDKKDILWALELNCVANNIKMPFKNVGKNIIEAEFRDNQYRIECKESYFKRPNDSENFVFRILPELDSIVIINPLYRIFSK